MNPCTPRTNACWNGTGWDVSALANTSAKLETDKENLGLMLIRLASALQKANPSSPLPNKARDLFISVGLIQSITRRNEGAIADSVAKTDQNLLRNNPVKEALK